MILQVVIRSIRCVGVGRARARAYVYLCLRLFLCLCLCFFVCVCVHVYISVSFRVCFHVCVSASLPVCMHVSVLVPCVCVCVYMCLSVALFVCVFACVCICLSLHVCVRMCLYLCFCICVCIYIGLCVSFPLPVRVRVHAPLSVGACVCRKGYVHDNARWLLLRALSGSIALALFVASPVMAFNGGSRSILAHSRGYNCARSGGLGGIFNISRNLRLAILRKLICNVSDICLRVHLGMPADAHIIMNPFESKRILHREIHNWRIHKKIH